MFRIVRASNFDKDWYNEEFVNLPPMNQVNAEELCDLINDIICLHPNSEHYYKVVPEDYKLHIGMVA